MKTIKTSKTAKTESVKTGLINDLFDEVQDEINEDIIKEAKLKIKALLQQKVKIEKLMQNTNRQIDDLKLQINQEFFV